MVCIAALRLSTGIVDALGARTVSARSSTTVHGLLHSVSNQGGCQKIEEGFFNCTFGNNVCGNATNSRQESPWLTIGYADSLYTRTDVAKAMNTSNCVTRCDSETLTQCGVANPLGPGGDHFTRRLAFIAN